MNDAELLATAALANVEAVLMAGDNAQRAIEGYGPAWREGTGIMEYGEKLREELYRREKIKTPVAPSPEASGLDRLEKILRYCSVESIGTLTFHELMKLVEKAEATDVQRPAAKSL